MSSRMTCCLRARHRRPDTNVSAYELRNASLLYGDIARSRRGARGRRRSLPVLPPVRPSIEAESTADPMDGVRRHERLFDAVRKGRRDAILAALTTHGARSYL